MHLHADTSLTDYRRKKRQQFTPLILSDCDDAKLLPHLNEPDSSKRFSQNVCQLLVSAHMLNINNAFSNTFSDIMISSINVLGSLMVHRIFAELLSRLAVNVKSELLHFSASEISQQPA